MNTDEKLIAKLIFFNYFINNDYDKEYALNKTTEYMLSKEVDITKEEIEDYINKELKH